MKFKNDKKKLSEKTEYIKQINMNMLLNNIKR